MTRTLSWGGTFLFMRLFPTVWIAGFGFGTVLVFRNPAKVVWNGVPGAAPSGVEWLFLGAWIIGTIFLFFFTRGIRCVRLSSDHLLVSNYVREVAIPLTEVSAVRQRLFPHFGAVTVQFRSETPVGLQVTFIPTGRMARWFGEEGAIIEDLRAAVKQANSQSPAA